jgi:catechol 2,3-dioxygenase
VRDLIELRPSDAPGPAPQRATGLFHTAFLYPARGQLGAALLRIAREQAPFTGASDHLVSEALYLDDLDALGIELYRDRPRETWPPPAPGERIKMDTLPLDLRALAAEAEGDAGGVRIGHVHLKVADLDRALAFYCDVLGFQLMQRMGAQAAFISAGGYHHHIGLNTWESSGGSPPPPGTTGLYHLAVLYPTRAALADALRRLVAADIPLDGASDHGVSEALYLRDPDENGVELYWDRPREQWPRTTDGKLSMFTRRLDLMGLLAEKAPQQQPG